MYGLRVIVATTFAGMCASITGELFPKEYLRFEVTPGGLEQVTQILQEMIETSMSVGASAVRRLVPFG